MIFSTKCRTLCFAAMAIVAILFGMARSAEAQATGTIIGTVRDGQGGVIPGATVSIVSETRGTSIDAVTNATGDFVLSNIPGDVYTVKVTLSGFKTTERKAVPVSPGDRVALGTVTLGAGQNFIQPDKEGQGADLTIANLVHQVGAVAPVSTCTGRGASDRRSVRPCC